MRLFVTGTDTDVGKTAITACLARAARQRGSVVAAKPVASGVATGTAGEDALALGAAAGHAPRVYATFADPVSPHRASAIAGTPVDDGVLDWIAALAADTVLVEGVGGWRVPVRADPGGLWVRDLARAAGGPVVIVAPDRVGVLNHALLTVDAVRRDGLAVAGVVLNRGASPPDAGRPHNLADLRDLLDVPVVPVERIAPDDPDAARAAGEAVLRGIVGAVGER
ncbi:MAG: dethiobiotin synthase [Myxococcota bacterium]